MAQRVRDSTWASAVAARVGEKRPGEPVEAAGGVLVDVGVPGGGEGDAELVGEPGSEEAELAGAGDVDDVGAEAEEFALDAGDVAGEEGVEGEVFFDADGGEAAGEFEGPEWLDCWAAAGVLPARTQRKGRLWRCA